jgi:glycosyltransferase involved in cell wall biosynthesis
LEDYVVLTGAQNREVIKKYLSMSSVFTLPCIVAQDGNRDVLANVLKEAMSMEVPVVTSDLPGIDELIQHNYNGLLFKQECHIALSDALEKLLLEPERAKEMGARGRQIALSDFCSKTEPEKLLNVFLSVLENSQKIRS